MAVTDTDPGFDTLAYAQTLRKADLNALRAELRADLYRALWIQTGAIAGTIVAAAGFVVAVKLM